MSLSFTTSKTNLEDYFNEISSEDIQNYCGSKLFYKGSEYHENGSILEVDFNFNKTLLKAVVKGSLEYKVVISLNNTEVSAGCSCPYGGFCKHIVAVLLNVIDENADIGTVFESKSIDNKTVKYLKSLSKPELASLVMKYAPEQFFTQINNKFSDSNSAQYGFKKIKANIQDLFKDQDLLYEPDGFDFALNKELLKLSGLEKHLKDEIENLLFFILSQIETLMQDGYLDDYQNDYSYNPSTDFNGFVIGYVKSLKYEEKTNFLIKLESVLGEQSCTTFDSLKSLTKDVFTEKELPALKIMLLKDYKILSTGLVENFYIRVRHLLNFNEKEIILTMIQNNSSNWIIELAKLYESQNEIIKAIEAIKKWLSENIKMYGNNLVFELYLELSDKAGFDLTKVAKEAISNNPSSNMLQKIESLGVKEMNIYELILEKANASQLLVFLEANNRVTDALSLIKRSKNIWEEKVYGFYKKHKNEFPSDAELFFSETIDKNLGFADDNHYRLVAESILLLKQINKPRAEQYLAEIRLAYKRRRNLITILSEL